MSEFSPFLQLGSSLDKAAANLLSEMVHQGGSKARVRRNSRKFQFCSHEAKLPYLK